MIVVDNTAISYLLIEGTFTPWAEKVREADPHWIAPPLWLSEFLSVLRKHVVTSNISVELALQTINLAEELMRERVVSVIPNEVLLLSLASGCMTGTTSQTRVYMLL